MEELNASAQTPEAQPSKRKQEEERLRQLRTRARLEAAQLLTEGRTYAGTLLALAAAVLPPHRLEAALSRLQQDQTDGLALAASHLLGAAALKGSWPGGYGWRFLEPHLERAAASGQAELVLHLAHLSTTTPLFLAATLAAAAENWGLDERLLKLAKTLEEKAVPLARSNSLRALLGPLPGEPKGAGQPPRRGNGSGR